MRIPDQNLLRLFKPSNDVTKNEPPGPPLSLGFIDELCSRKTYPLIRKNWYQKVKGSNLNEHFVSGFLISAFHKSVVRQLSSALSPIFADAGVIRARYSIHDHIIRPLERDENGEIHMDNGVPMITSFTAIAASPWGSECYPDVPPAELKGQRMLNEAASAAFRHRHGAGVFKPQPGEIILWNDNQMIHSAPSNEQSQQKERRILVRAIIECSESKINEKYEEIRQRTLCPA